MALPEYNSTALGRVPFANAQDSMPETAVEQLFQILVKATQFTFYDIIALFLQRGQQIFNPLADKGYTVIGTVFRPHVAAIFSQIGTDPLLKGGGEYCLPFVEINEQINGC